MKKYIQPATETIVLSAKLMQFDPFSPGALSTKPMKLKSISFSEDQW